jgi:hypothetical protein
MARIGRERGLLVTVTSARAATRERNEPYRDVRCELWPLQNRAALRVGDDRVPGAHGAPRPRVCLLRSALRLPCGAERRVRDALLPYDDDPLHAVT